jgi:hypothetical protein
MQYSRNRKLVRCIDSERGHKLCGKKLSEKRKWRYNLMEWIFEVMYEWLNYVLVSIEASYFAYNINSIVS